ncbi:uncharacterized protein EMH_0052250 [Eimeria mitis]|uniref:Uncharacterized protein n=1 Tax=Eimeria mitis TaxID=44415 RepID=U6K0A0_9EIME|nr:uncharacterized protein EMH_0052250 [Eimeria mitis]CDJ29742.1 hypothetical protein EMH_0052250 [Eimeria mitis]
METAGALFGQLLAIGALPLSISIADGDTHTRRRHSGISKHISDRELRRLQLPSLLSALLPPAAPLEDRGGSNDSVSSNSDALPVQQQALVVRGAASLVLQQWVLLAADALQLLRRLLQPEKQHHRRNSSSNNADNHQLLGRQQQQDSRRKRVRTTEAQREDDGEEQQEDADEAADAIWERAAQLQLQQQQGEEESQQRLKRLGSVFATHLQEAESSPRLCAPEVLDRGSSSSSKSDHTKGFLLQQEKHMLPECRGDAGRSEALSLIPLSPQQQQLPVQQQLQQQGKVPPQQQVK